MQVGKREEEVLVFHGLPKWYGSCILASIKHMMCSRGATKHLNEGRISCGPSLKCELLIVQVGKWEVGDQVFHELPKWYVALAFLQV